MGPMARLCPFGLEERETGSFRNLTWLNGPSMLANGGGTVRWEEMDWGLGAGHARIGLPLFPFSQ